MPPGGWAAAVALSTPQGAAAAAARQAVHGPVVAGQPCAVGVGLANPAVVMATSGRGYYRNECYWGGPAYPYYYGMYGEIWATDMMVMTVLASSCDSYIAGGGYYVDGEIHILYFSVVRFMTQ